MSNPHDEFTAAFDRYLDAVGPVDAMTVATSIFVGLVVSYADAKGADVEQPIHIDGGEERDITIHPPKRASQPKEPQ